MSELRSESDYGTELDWDDETLEATLQAIEQRASLNRADSTAKTALQHVPIEVEALEQAQIATRIAGGPDEASGAEGTDDEMTALRPSRLWELYRQRRGWGALSVSDLSGPAWCEVQHTYRLASKPFLPPLERPATITTSAGATIEIDTKRTVRREGILDRGKEIHRKIEKQVMGDVEEVKVNVSGKEEWWALRILNTIVCLETLLATGKVRELPVFGWIGSHLVFGVIDEVERREVKRDSRTSKPLASASAPVRASPRRKKSNAKKAATSEKDDQSKLDSFFSILRSPAKRGEHASDAMAVDLTETEAPNAPLEDATPGMGTSSSTAATSSLPVAESPSSPSWGFLLSDTKTRYNRSIPAPSESRPARLQLMLYHRLLSGLIDSGASEPSLPAATSFSWSRLYAHLSLAPDEPLSEDFLASIDPVLESSESLGGRGRLSTLSDYIGALQRVGALLRGERPTALLDDLEIVYRLRSDSDKTFCGRRGQKRVASVTAIPAYALPADAKTRRLSLGAAAEPADQAQDDADLARAIALSLMDAEERDPDQKAAAADTRVEEPSDIDAESQPEDSQLPFYANPSLPVIVPSSPERQSTSSITEGGGPDPLGTAFTLPQNSQADAPDPQDGTLSKPILQPRYNLRKRSSSNAAISAPPVPATTPPLPTTPSSKASRKPSVPKSPKALGDKDLIGIDRFKNSPLELDQYLGRILAYWDGERAPEGVALAQTHRCRSCEFEEGCEWRALKAAEVSREARERRLAREKRR